MKPYLLTEEMFKTAPRRPKSLRGFSFLLAFGAPVWPSLWFGGKKHPHLKFRIACGPVVLSIVPLDLEAIMGNHAELLNAQFDAIDSLTLEQLRPLGFAFGDRATAQSLTESGAESIRQYLREKLIKPQVDV